MFKVYEKYIPVEELNKVCLTYLDAVNIYDKAFNPNAFVTTITYKEAAKKAIEGTNLDPVWVDTFEYWMRHLWNESVDWATNLANQLTESELQKIHADEKQLMLLVSILSRICQRNHN